MSTGPLLTQQRISAAERLDDQISNSQLHNQPTPDLDQLQPVLTGPLLTAQKSSQSSKSTGVSKASTQPAQGLNELPALTAKAAKDALLASTETLSQPVESQVQPGDAGPSGKTAAHSSVAESVRSALTGHAGNASVASRLPLKPTNGSSSSMKQAPSLTHHDSDTLHGGASGLLESQQPGLGSNSSSVNSSMRPARNTSLPLRASKSEPTINPSISADGSPPMGRKDPQTVWGTGASSSSPAMDAANASQQSGSAAGSDEETGASAHTRNVQTAAVGVIDAAITGLAGGWKCPLQYPRMTREGIYADDLTPYLLGGNATNCKHCRDPGFVSQVHAA